MRTVYVIRDGVAVPKHQAAPITQRGPRSHLPTPRLNLDTCAETVHPVTGQVFTSKSEFRKVTKAFGYTEVGNETPPAYTPPPAETAQDELRRVWEQAEQGHEAPQWQETNQEHPDLAGQSMTILQPHGTKPSGPEMELARQAGAAIRELPAPAPSKPPLTTA